MKIVAMIPARLGSTRIKNKNIRYLGNKPLVEHIIEQAKKSKMIDEIYLNSESLIFEKIADNQKINFYKRNKKYSSNKATNDDFALDFLNNVNCDILIQLLPTSPFIDSKLIDNFILEMIKKSYDTLISVKDVKIECVYKNKAINFEKKEQTPPSQLLEPIKAYACGIMGWNKNNYIKNMKKYSSAYHGGSGKIGYFKIDGFSTIDIDNEEDFTLAEAILKTNFSSKNKKKFYFNPKRKLIFDSNVKKILAKDGVINNNQKSFNKLKVDINKILKNKPKNKSWSHTLVNSDSNSATLIAQLPGEGNRMHFHPDWNEWWYIFKGNWKWEIDGKTKIIKSGEMIYIPKNKIHKITSIGKGLSIRLAVSRYDVDHVYLEKNF